MLEGSNVGGKPALKSPNTEVRRPSDLFYPALITLHIRHSRSFSRGSLPGLRPTADQLTRHSNSEVSHHAIIPTNAKDGMLAGSFSHAATAE